MGLLLLWIGFRARAFNLENRQIVARIVEPASYRVDRQIAIADAQAPLARAVVGGLAGSTLITLVLIPAVYSLFHPNPKARGK